MESGAALATTVSGMSHGGAGGVVLLSRARVTATGMWTVGTAVLFGVRRTSANRQAPRGSPLTFAVKVIVRVAPGATLKLDGLTVSVIPVGVVAEAVQVTVPAAEPLTVRVHVHVSAQAGWERLARLSVVGSPPMLGSAAW